MQAAFWNRTAFWGITYRQLAGVLILYAVAVLLYSLSLSISERTWSKKPLWADFLAYLPRNAFEYGLKLLLTVPVWYWIFVRLRHRPLLHRLAAHLIMLPLFILVWQTVYYTTADALKMGRLRASAQIWDTYIGSLFYLVQFGIFHAYAYYRDLQRQREQEAALRELALKSELSALKAQLNPHFLYNVFNTIAASVPPEQERTRELIAELSDLFRYQLRATKADLVPIRDELAFVQKYLDLEKARFGERLRVQFDVAPEVLDQSMPPMLLQPLVENAVRHGIAPLIAGGDVTIRIHRQNGHLHYVVADTGVGLNGTAPPGGPAHGRYAGAGPSADRLPQNGATAPADRLPTLAGHGVGLTNTRLRLDKMFGATLSLTPNQPRGVVVAFQIPIN